MTEPTRDAGAPRRLLLATDLGSRCDRALDRAAGLASAWGAELHVVHAVEAAPPVVPLGVDADAYLRRFPDPRLEAMRELRRLVGGLATALHVERAPAAPAILDVAAREGCDLIVLGETRGRLVGPLESTADSVVRKARASVLVVRDRPTTPYRRLLVGTDFSDEARQALERAGRLFPAASITLVHAHSVPYAGLVRPSASEDAMPRLLDALRSHVETAALPAASRQAIRTEVVAGTPAAVLRQQVVDGGFDLTVIGAHPRGVLFDAMVGSARHIVDAVPGDVLVVRALPEAGG